MLSDCEFTTCREAALILHDIGLPIVLCRGRNPLDPDWQTHDYSADEIVSKFDDQPDLNLGVLLGWRSNLIEVIEPTNDDGWPLDRDLYELLDGAFPETPTFESRGSYHRLFAWDDRLVSLDWPVAKVRSLTVLTGGGDSGAFALLPPSVTDGVPREWRLTLDDYEGDVARLPNSVVDEIINATFVGRQSDVESGCWCEYVPAQPTMAFYS